MSAVAACRLASAERVSGRQRARLEGDSSLVRALSYTARCHPYKEYATPWLMLFVG